MSNWLRADENDDGTTTATISLDGHEVTMVLPVTFMALGFVALATPEVIALYDEAVIIPEDVTG